MLAAALTAVVLSAVFFSYSGWVQMPWMEYRVFLEHGHVLKESWIRDDKAYFYADADGKPAAGLQWIDGARYFFDEETGRMQTGWKTLAAGRGESSASDGSTEEVSADASIQEDPAAEENVAGGTAGAAAEENVYAGSEKMYFRPDSGKAAVGWEEIEGSMYLFSADGVMQTGWTEADGKRYFLDESGKMRTGWLDVEGIRYYLGEDGAMQAGCWVEQDGKKYLLDAEGHLCTGRQKRDGKEYYFDKNGVLQDGWVEKGGRIFYYGEDGVMKTGLVTVEGETYYLSSDGRIRSGLQTEGEDTFYVCSDGFVIDPEAGTGNYGRLIVHSAGLDVFLYTAHSRDEYQQVVDAENSALVVQERRDLEPVIADRRSQGFDLSGVEADSLAAVVYPDGSVEEFVCVRTDKGVNLEWDVIDLSGDSIWKQNEGGLCAYASAGSDNREEVIVIYWEPLHADT